MGRVDLRHIHGLRFFSGVPVCEASLPDTATLIGTPLSDFWKTLKEKYPQHYQAGRMSHGICGWSMDVARNYDDRYHYD